MRNRHLLGWLRLLACCWAVFMALGACTYLMIYFLTPYLLARWLGGDGMVGVHGWVVEAPLGQNSDITMKEKEVDQPRERVIVNAWVELWSGDGKSLLDRPGPGVRKDGYFGVSKVGPYARGMRYLIKAGAPGYRPLSKKVKLRRAGAGNCALIQLAPIKQEDRQGQ